MNELPLHPLLVHLPVVMLPLTALAVIAVAFSRRWFNRLAPYLAGGSVLGAIGAVLAAATGEELLHNLGEHSALLERHAELGDATEGTAIGFAVAVLILVALYWDHAPTFTRRYGEKFDRGYLPIAIITVLLAIAVLVLVILTGHAGAQSVWQG